jgi:hypothetical protein
MRPPPPSPRRMLVSASLLLVGFALVAIAIQLLTGFSLDNDAITDAFWYVGLTLIGAVVLWPALTSGTVWRLDGLKLATLRPTAAEHAGLGLRSGWPCRLPHPLPTSP